MLQLFRYEMRAQWKRFLIISIMIAIALSCFMIVDAFIVYAKDRVAAEAKPIAGADIVLDSNRTRTRDSTDAVKNILQDQGSVSQRIKLNTNITSSTDSRLVQLLGVDTQYPLYGNIVVAPLSGRQFVFGGGVAVDQKTFDMLDDNKITVGDIVMEVDGIIQENPGLSLNLFTQGRQVIVPLSRMQETGLLRTGSRSEYEYLIKVDDASTSEALMTKFRNDSLLKSQRDVDDYQSRVSQVGDLLKELGVYLLLVIFCAFLLVAVTSMLSIDEYIFRRLKTFSIMQILGVGKKQLLGFYSMIFLCMVVVACSISLGISYVVAMQLQNIPLIAGFSLSSGIIRQGMLVCFILTAVAWILPLLKILLRTPLSGLAESSINISTKIEKILGLSIVVVGIVGVLYSIGESRWRTGQLAGIVLFGYCIVRLLIRGLLRCGNKMLVLWKPSFILSDAIRSTTRPGNTSILIASTLIVALSTTLMMTQVAGSFVDRLRFTNTNQPNWFVINVQKNDISVLRDAGIQDAAYNIVLGRILRVHNIPLSDYIQQKIERTHDNQGGGQGRFTREFNITTVELPKQDTVAGESTVPHGGVSLDQEFARDLRVGLGDTIVLQIAGREFDLKITGLRKTNRTNFSPFFFMQLNSEQFAQAPMTYFLAMNVKEDQKPTTRKILGSLLSPGVAFVEIDSIVASVRTISSRIIEVVRILLVIILLFSCFTTIVCVENMRYAKRFKMYLYHILGATVRQTRFSVIAEYGYVFVVAVIASMLVGWGISMYVVGASSLLFWSWNAMLQGFLSIVLVVAINIGVIARTLKEKNA